MEGQRGENVPVLPGAASGNGRLMIEQSGSTAGTLVLLELLGGGLNQHESARSAFYSIPFSPATAHIWPGG